jgi:hypothetical protein
MKMRCLFLLILSVVWVFPARPASAQSPARFEAGVQASLLRLSDLSATNAGVGGRMSFDLTNLVALDGEVTFFPRDTIRSTEFTTSFGAYRVVSHRRRTDALLGVRLSARGERLGAFLRLRPGVTRLSDKGTECVGPGCAVVLMLLARNTYRPEFAFDLGGGVEFYPTSRTVARAELGDTMIRHRSLAPPCPANECTSHNLSTRFGMGLRF